jgi:hypothetical protein
MRAALLADRNRAAVYARMTRAVAQLDENENARKARTERRNAAAKG